MELYGSMVYWISRLATLMQEDFNSHMTHHNVTWPQYMVLNAVYFDHAKTPAQIAHHIGVDRSAITRLVDRLEAKELVERNRESVDRRSINIILTRKGRAMMPKLIEDSIAHQQHYLDYLPAEERDRFKQGLKILLKAAGQDPSRDWIE